MLAVQSGAAKAAPEPIRLKSSGQLTMEVRNDHQVVLSGFIQIFSVPTSPRIGHSK